MIRMLEVLSPRQKEIIYYRFVEGLSYEEILPDHGYELPIYPESDTKVFKKATYHFLTGRNAICPAPSYQHVTYNCL